MLFPWISGPKIDKINELLDKDDVTLEEILQQDYLSISVRNQSNHKFFSYLEKPEIMNELLKWALTDSYADNPKYLKLCNSTLTILSNSRPFEQILLENETFINYLKKFISTKPPSTRTCGHFLRIMEALLHESNGDFLKKLPNFQTFLIDNINDIALKDLFVLIVTEFSDSFNLDTELLTRLVNKINEENCIQVVSAIREIIDSNKSIISLLNSEELIEHLFVLATENSEANPLIATELFRLLRTFKELSCYKSVQPKFVNSYQYQPNCSFSYAVFVIGKLTPNIFDFFFDTASCTHLIEAIYQAFLEKPPEEQLEIVQRENLLAKIKENFCKSKTNARLSDLAVFLNEKFNGRDGFDDKFSEFVEKEVKSRVNLRKSKYGGEIMSDIYKNSESDDLSIEDEEAQYIRDITCKSNSSESSGTDESDDQNEEIGFDKDEEKSDDDDGDGDAADADGEKEAGK